MEDKELFVYHKMFFRQMQEGYNKINIDLQCLMGSIP